MSWDNGIHHGDGCRLWVQAVAGKQQQAAEVLESRLRAKRQSQSAPLVSWLWTLRLGRHTDSS